MKCDNLKAYLDGELGVLGRLIMRRHIRMCEQCRTNAVEWTRLSCEIEQLEGDPVPPTLRERLMADAMTAAATTRSHEPSPAPQQPRAQGVWTMRRASLAAVFAVIMVAVGLVLLPRAKENTVLADMANAMARVGSVHFTGFAVEENGVRRELEGWVKGPGMIRIRVQDVVDICDDGQKLIAAEWGDLPKVTVRSSGNLPGLAKGMTYLDLFSGTGRMRSVMAANGATVTGRTKVTLPGGQACQVTELMSDSGARMRVFTDSRTDLLVRSETYDRSGRLVEAIEAVEYDVQVADSEFKMSIPRGLPVLDMESPEESEGARSRRAEFERLLKDPNAKFLLSMEQLRPGETGSCGTFIHPGVQFDVYSPGLAAVFYLADENVYRIIGKGRAHSMKDGWHSDTVEDGDIRVPGEPQVEEVLMLNGKGGAYCGKGRGGAYRFVNIDPGPATVTYHQVKDAFVIRGTVKVLPTGRVCANDVVLPMGKMYANDIVKQVAIFNQDLTEHVNSGKALDWGGLPHSEIESMKADLDVALRVGEINDSRNRAGKAVINGGVASAQYGGSGVSHGIRFDVAGPGTRIMALEVPSRQALHIIGRARVQMEGKPDRIVKNAVLNYDGEILSTEE